MVRRDPEAIVLAHKMDPRRRDLYVEGARDRRFFSWLTGDVPRPESRVVEIAAVDLPGVHVGGERARVIRFAELVGESQRGIRCFVDADYDRLLGRGTDSEIVWLTDSRDLEGYTLHRRCINKMLTGGVQTDRVKRTELLQNVLREGRRVGLLRVYSECESLGLPFQRTDLARHVRCSGCEVSVDLDSYARALIQNSGRSLDELQGVLDGVAALSATHKSTPNSELVHGKDAFCLIEKALSPCGLKRGEVARLMWVSLERRDVEDSSNLARAVEFLLDPVGSSCGVSRSDP